MKITESKFQEIIAEAIEKVIANYENPQTHNITLFTDGDEVTEISHHGSIDYRGEKIQLYTISSNQMLDYEGIIRENMTDEQKEACDERGWLAMCDSSSENPENWEDSDEWTAKDDDWSYIEGVIEEKLNERVELI